MIMSELWGRWDLHKDRVRIYGSKTKARNRSVPMVEPIKHPDFNRKHLQVALTTLGVESYTARKTYAGWLEQCGFLRSFRKLYLGHSVQDITDLYEMADREGLWAEHGAALRHLLQQPSQQAEAGRIA
jgi:integrase